MSRFFIVIACCFSLSEFSYAETNEQSQEIKKVFETQDTSSIHQWITTNKIDTDTLAQYKIEEEPLIHYLYDKKEFDKVFLLLKLGIDVDQKDPLNWSLVHKAVLDKETQFLNDLVPFNPDLEAQNSKKETPLHIAVKKGHLEMATWLLEKGASTKAKNIQGETPIFYAVKNENQAIFELLKAHQANLKETDLSGNSLLHVASSKKSQAFVEKLLEEKLDINLTNLDIYHPLTPLDILEELSAPEEIISLVKKNGGKNASPIFMNHWQIGASFFVGENAYTETNAKDATLLPSIYGTLDLNYYINPSWSFVWSFGAGITTNQDLVNIYAPGTLFGLFNIFSFFTIKARDEIHSRTARIFFLTLYSLSWLLPEGIVWHFYPLGTSQLQTNVVFKWAVSEVVLFRDRSSFLYDNMDFFFQTYAKLSGQVAYFFGKFSMQFEAGISLTYDTGDFGWFVGLGLAGALF